MADSAAFKPAPASNGHIAVALRVNEPSADAQAGRPRAAGGPLRPSQVPVPGETTRRTGSQSPAGGQARHRRQRLRPNGAPAGAALSSARPSTVPARPIRDQLHDSGQTPTMPPTALRRPRPTPAPPPPAATPSSATRPGASTPPASNSPTSPSNAKAPAWQRAAFRLLSRARGR
jgi:hypothetical protein